MHLCTYIISAAAAKGLQRGWKRVGAGVSRCPWTFPDAVGPGSARGRATLNPQAALLTLEVGPLHTRLTW